MASPSPAVPEASRRAKLYSADGVLGGFRLSSDVSGAMAQLPSSLTTLVQQLNATEAALEAAGDQAAIMTHMYTRDEKITFERKQDYEARKRELAQLNAQVTEMHGIMFEETSARTQIAKELHEAMDQSRRTRHTQSRRLRERASKAEHSGWFRKRLQQTPRQLASEALDAAASAVAAANGGQPGRPSSTGKRPPHPAFKGAGPSPRPSAPNSAAAAAAADAAAAAAAADWPESGEPDDDEEELPAEFHSEGYAAFILIGDRIGAQDEDEVLALVEGRLEQLESKEEAEDRLRQLRAQADQLQERLQRIKSLGGAVDFEDLIGPDEPSDQAGNEGSGGGEAPEVSERNEASTASELEANTLAEQQQELEVHKAEKRSKQILESLELRTTRLTEAFSGLRHLQDLATAALDKVAPRLLPTTTKEERAERADRLLFSSTEAEVSGGDATQSLPALHESTTKILDRLSDQLEELHGYATDPKKAAAAQTMAKAAFRASNRERHRASIASGPAAAAGRGPAAAAPAGSMRLPMTHLTAVPQRDWDYGSEASAPADDEGDDFIRRSDFKLREQALKRNPNANVYLPVQAAAKAPAPAPTAPSRPAGKPNARGGAPRPRTSSKR